ncbi:MAG: GAF domain-containing protein [Terriglobales bacterium]
MDRSTEALQGPLPPSPRGDRRRRIRHKLHTPIFASFNGPQTGTTVDLSELIDLNEGGFCVRTGIQSSVVSISPLPTIGFGSDERRNGDGLEVNHPVTICLDLPETRSYIHGSGLVVWRDEAGRAGIRFSFLSEHAMGALKEWLFVNLLVASANYSARAGQLERYHQEEAKAADESCATAITAVLLASANRAPDRSQPVSSLEGLAAEIREADAAEAESVRMDVRQAHIQEPEDRDLAADLEPASLEILHKANGEAQAVGIDQSVLQSIAERALILTGASGSAMALLTGGRMVCCARAGDPAPPLGLEVSVESGLSGECLCTGLPALCEDTATDPRVDSELCRAIGIGSFIATPILSDCYAIGLLEVFSPQAGKFSKAEAEILEHLAELVTGANTEIPHSDTGVIDETSAEYATASTVEDWDQPIHEYAEPLMSADASPAEPAATIMPDFASDAEQPKAETNRTIPFEIEIPMSQAASPESASGGVTGPVHEASAANPRAHGETASGDAHEDAAALANLRDALWERVPELEREADAARLHEEIESAQHEAAPPVRSHAVHLALILASLAAVCLALGYLLAPVIERHLNGGSRSAQISSTSPNLSRRPETGKLQPDDLRRMAEQGNPEAQFLLGTLYRSGDGVLQDDKQAVDWFQRAADQGYVRALSALGASYWSGRGVPQDYSKAYFWYELALAEGDQNSKSLLEGLSTQLTSEQVANIRQQAEAWLHAHNQPATPNPK